MAQKLIPALFIFLMALILHEQKLSRQSFKFRQSSESVGTEALYDAVVTGDKSGVSRALITTMKEFGMMHLLTPSGLHLSSFLILFFLFPRVKLFVTVVLLIIFHFTVGFLALKRMLIFYLINYWLKNAKLSFIATFFISLVSENYIESPLSFCFTFIFWGSIIFNDSGKWKLALNMFILQAIVACIFTQKINLAAIIINPLVTIVFSLVFPIVLVGYPVPGLHSIGLWVLEIFSHVIHSLQHLHLLTVAGPVAIMIVLSFYSRLRPIMLTAALMISTNLGTEKKLSRRMKSSYYPIPSGYEFLNAKKRRFNFIDRRCQLNFIGDVACKKKPSEYGGPDI
ncbi:MAG: ComEC/Rec2 family competence protein [Bacteriovoracaceae bacterium]|nr:ComEC/Rec2 family competence protein [Bacteriovoracaceae bacterium]